MEEAREVVKQGIRPTMWEPYASGGEDGSLKKDPIVKAFMKAMDLCFEKEPEKRGTSIQVARVLHKALMKEVAREEEESEAQQETLTFSRQAKANTAILSIEYVKQSACVTQWNENQEESITF